MIPNLGDIICNRYEHWLVYDRVEYRNNVIQYKVYVLDRDTYSTYTAPHNGVLPDLFTLAA